MPVTVNDFRHRVILRSLVEKVDADGSVIRKKQQVGTIWAALQPLSVQGHPLGKLNIKADDAQANFIEVYQMCFRECRSEFDEVVWNDKVLKRTSAIIKDSGIQRCLLSRCEEKAMGVSDV